MFTQVTVTSGRASRQAVTRGTLPKRDISGTNISRNLGLRVSRKKCSHASRAAPAWTGGVASDNA